MSSSPILPASPLFSVGADNFIRLLNPGSRPAGTSLFPAAQAWRGKSLRFSGNEKLGDWFLRIIGPKETAQSTIQDCEVDDGLALFGEISWNANGIYFIGLQAFVIEEGTLFEFYDDPGNQALRPFYYRLDLDLSKIGEIFKEPLPHLHCVPNGAPRIHFHTHPDQFLPISFVEFLYLNHFHDKWKSWAKLEALNADESLPFDHIVAAYKASNSTLLLSALNTEITKLKATLSQVKKSHIPTHKPIKSGVQLLNYY